MDPNANVLEQNALRLSLARDAAADCAQCDIDLERLAELDEALCAWLANGGFAPTEHLLSAADIAAAIARD